MQNIVSETELEHDLAELRLRLRGLPFAEEARNVIFLNIDAFYAYIDQKAPSRQLEPCRSLPALMARVEPFIPLLISNNGFDAFVDAVLEEDVAEIERLERGFTDSSRVRFVHAASGCGDEEWEKLAVACRTVRGYKEEDRASWGLEPGNWSLEPRT